MKAFCRLLILILTLSTALSRADDFPKPGFTEELPASLRNIQRTMRLLATSTPDQRNTVRVLFYGQSITEQAWTKIVAEDLKQRFPHADLVIENRAIGGHSSQLLVKTAEADLYPFQPDLPIFHVYGAHDKYEEIIRSVRERTCAEILLQNDHVTRPEHLKEETDPAKAVPGKGDWDAFMNHNFLPGIAKKYGAAYCDQRGVWKRYLTEHNLAPSALLKDSVHLHKHGEFLMAEIVKHHLRYEPALNPSPAEAWIKTLAMGTDLQPQAGKISVPFTGSRIEAIVSANAEGPGVSVTIDGKPPTNHAETYVFTRTSAYPRSNWPCILKVGTKAALQEEEWTLTMKDVSPDLKTFAFDLVGSKTGPDGSGTRNEPFTSTSGRVVIDPADWNLDYCLKVFKEPVSSGFTVRWKSVPRGTDQISKPSVPAPGTNHPVTLTQGLKNGQHTLELTGDASQRVIALRVYAPPLLAK